MAGEQPISVTELEKANIAWMANHLRTYLGSGGARGHIIDMSHLGGLDFTTTLLLKTIGRKSGQPRILPLIYGDIGGEVVLMASRGGADIHPGWYFNMTAVDTVDIQIGTQAFRATWRELAGGERERAWALMTRNIRPSPII